MPKRAVLTGHSLYFVYPLSMQRYSFICMQILFHVDKIIDLCRLHVPGVSEDNGKCKESRQFQNRMDARPGCVISVLPPSGHPDATRSAGGILIALEQTTPLSKSQHQSRCQNGARAGGLRSQKAQRSNFVGPVVYCRPSGTPMASRLINLYTIGEWLEGIWSADTQGRCFL